MFRYRAQITQQLGGIPFDTFVQHKAVSQAPDRMGKTVFQRAGEAGLRAVGLALISHKHQ